MDIMNMTDKQCDYILAIDTALQCMFIVAKSRRINSDHWELGKHVEELKKLKLEVFKNKTL